MAKQETIYTPIADEIGTLRAQIDLMKEQLKDLEADLAPGAIYEGDLFRVTPVEGERTTVAWKAIAEKMHASRQMITANSRKTSYLSYRCTAKNK